MLFSSNVRSEKKNTKSSSDTLLHLVFFFRNGRYSKITKNPCARTPKRVTPERRGGELERRNDGTPERQERRDAGTPEHRKKSSLN